MHALIIVDIQTILCQVARSLYQGDEIIPIVNELQKSFSLIVATQDWHPALHKSFASSHPGNKVFDKNLYTDWTRYMARSLRSGRQVQNFTGI